MPRKARIDAPGALHHIIIRGIERKAIFKDNTDRDNFVERLGQMGAGLNLKSFGILGFASKAMNAY